MKLYHYVKKGSNVMQEGLLSFAKSPYADIDFYKKRSGQKTKAGIIKWMETCFKGRSRGIRFFTTPLKWTPKSLMIKKLIDECDLLEIDVEALEKDGLIEKVFFKPSVFDKKFQPPKDFKWLDEYLVPLNSIHDINLKYRQTWSKCDDSKGLRMGPLRFHLLVIKGGIIPPKYIHIKKQMKLYHYLPKENNARQVGILTLSKKTEEIKKYGKRLGTENISEITAWLEKTFPGRTRAISVLTEPVQTKGTDSMLKKWVTTKELISIDLNRLIIDGKIESIWCKECSDSNGKEEKLYHIQPDDIDFTPLPWEKCSKEKGLFFGVIRHYLIVLKEGVVPPEYISFQ